MPSTADLVSALARAYAVTASPADVAEVEAALDDLRELAGASRELEVEVSDGGLEVDGSPVGGHASDALAHDLESLGVTAFRLPPDLGPARARRFLEAVREAVDGGGVRMDFGAARATGMGRSIASLFAQRPDTAPPESRDRDVMDLVVSLSGGEEEERPAAGDVEAEAGEPPAGVEPIQAVAAGPERQPDLEELEDAMEATPAAEEAEEEPGEFDRGFRRMNELLQRFQEAEGPARREALDEIRDEIERLKEERALDALALTVERLVLAAEEGGEDEEALDLADELCTPGVLARVAMHLGVARQDERRQDLIRVAAHLGRDMGMAIADALTDAPNRTARRTYMEALESMGEKARPVAEEMAADSRWYIARNGVGLLGFLGGEETVQYLTTPLAHSDPRVRKETVIALARLGGEDAGNLVLGMLGDPVPDVRASAARALGVLHVEKAQRPLLLRLEEDDDPDVQVEVLKALGQLGDPGAVPAIEKRAVGGLFSRPATEVRIAAYRALARIGTPHARSLLKTAMEDRDLEVRTVVRSLVGPLRTPDAEEAEGAPDAEEGPEAEGADGGARAEDDLELEAGDHGSESEREEAGL